MKFKGKTAIVTGAGKGIGLEICSRLCQQGATVILNDMDPELAVTSAEKIGNNCIGFRGDAGDVRVIQEMVDTAIDQTGRLDITVANAGITLFGDFLTYSPSDFNRVMEVNLRGTFFLAQAAINQMKDQSSGGTLLFMSSVTGHQAHKNLGAYGMSKAGIEMLAKNLVIEVSQYNINVNALAPGATATERTLEDPEYTSVWSKLTPLGKPASVKDIANAAIFLLSDEAKHITGQTLVVDGGWTSISPSPY